jgi:hypothetical protein
MIAKIKLFSIQPFQNLLRQRFFYFIVPWHGFRNPGRGIDPQRMRSPFAL